jgi:hypothetical protein
MQCCWGCSANGRNTIFCWASSMSELAGCNLIITSEPGPDSLIFSGIIWDLGPTRNHRKFTFWSVPICADISSKMSPLKGLRWPSTSICGKWNYSQDPHGSGSLGSSCSSPCSSPVGDPHVSLLAAVDTSLQTILRSRGCVRFRPLYKARHYLRNL